MLTTGTSNSNTLTKKQYKNERVCTYWEGLNLLVYQRWKGAYLASDKNLQFEKNDLSTMQEPGERQYTE